MIFGDVAVLDYAADELAAETEWSRPPPSLIAPECQPVAGHLHLGREPAAGRT